MRCLILCTLVLSLLVAPACERAKSTNDASVQPHDDASSAMDGGIPADARTSRPGAGPLDPDQMIPCEPTITRLTKNPATGNITQRTSYLTADWPETNIPYQSWTCTEKPFNFLDCLGQTEQQCEIVGSLQTVCYEAIWRVAPDGTLFVYCTLETESDPDEDGVFENPSRDLYGRHYVAIVR
jgi:hypothetical protein